MRTTHVLVALCALGAPAFGQGVVSNATSPFPNFETGPTRPLMVFNNAGQPARLLALNTPDARLEVYTTSPSLAYVGSVMTGLEPVSIVRNPSNMDRVFVVNQLSDSVVEVDVPLLEVTRVIPIGDEPQDAVVIGNKLYVSCARTPNPGGSGTYPMVENCVAVWDLSTNAFVARLAVPGDKPRALVAVGTTVFVVPQNSGNKTTILTESEARAVGLAPWNDLPSDPNPPFATLANPLLSLIPPIPGGTPNTGGWDIPLTGRIVTDAERNNYVSMIPTGTNLPPYFSAQPAARTLPDADVIAIDSTTDTVSTSVTQGIGTTLYGMSLRPGTSELWIACTDANNRQRFEGQVAGTGISNRVVVVPATPGAAATQKFDLNNAFPGTAAPAHALPVAIDFFTSGGSTTAYVAAMGTDSVVLIDPAASPQFTGTLSAPIPVGLAVDATAKTLYVLCRGDKSIRVFDISSTPGTLTATVPQFFDPEPPIVTLGRKHLYGASAASNHGNGTMACASCHVFGHNDAIAWDLGHPEGAPGYYVTDLLTGPLGANAGTVAADRTQYVGMHPMKGPMTTQSLRGMAEGEPLHWRGDRRFFQVFRLAFPGLLAGPGTTSAPGLTAQQMQEFASFTRSLTFPPNPFGMFNRVHPTGSNEALGMNLFGMPPLTPTPYVGNLTCVGCHRGDFLGINGPPNFHGDQLTVNFDARPQLFNAPQLRGLYEKEAKNLTGYGTDHEGGRDSIRDFFDSKQFGGSDDFILFSGTQRNEIAAFVKAWDTGLSPSVGTEMLAVTTNDPAMQAILTTAEGLAAAGHFDIVVKGFLRVGGVNVPNGGWYDPSVSGYRADVAPNVVVTSAQILSITGPGANQGNFLFMAVPLGMGYRLGIDQDEDLALDGQERAAGTGLGNPDSDGDGFTDGYEMIFGSLPLVFASTPSGALSAPVFVAQPRDVFNTTATLHVECFEPATITVSVTGIATPFTSTQLRRVHDIVLSGLPAGTALTYSVTATGADAQTTTVTTPNAALSPLTTTVQHLHVENMTLSKQTTSGQTTITVTVTVRDHNNAAVPDNVPVEIGLMVDAPANTPMVPWSGLTAGGNGVATMVIGPLTLAPANLTAGILLVGSTTAGTWFVGNSASTSGWTPPNFYYEAQVNPVNFRTIAVP